MNNQGGVYLKTKHIERTFNKQIAVRNVLFAIMISLMYLLGKYLWPVHDPSTDPTSKIKYSKTTRIYSRIHHN